MIPFGRSGSSLLAVSLGIALACPIAFAQDNAASSPAPAFDVATIKPHPPNAHPSSIGIWDSPDGVTASIVTLPMMVQYAYGLLTVDQVSGAPDWAKGSQFDMQAKAGEADLIEMQKLSRDESHARRKLMMQALLADRFKLKVHAASRPFSVYELVVAKGGSKLKDAATDTDEQLEKDKEGKPLKNYFRPGRDTTKAQGYSMAQLANFLSQPVSGVGRRVVDKTGLTGGYDFTLNWSIYSSGVAVGNGVAMGSPAESAPSIFSALGAVGLKLQSATSMVDTIVIDHAEQPSEN